MQVVYFTENLKMDFEI